MKRFSFLYLLLFSSRAFSQPAMLDSTFGSNGVVLTNMGPGSIINSVAIQPDGKIVAAGNINNGSIHDFAVARYMTDGSLDTTFSGVGIKTFGFDSLSYDQANGVALQTDGKIVVAGITIDSSQHFALVRLNTDGTFDTTFSGDGKLKTSFGIQYDLATCLLIQPNGKIIVAGASVNNPYFTYAFALARYLPDGTLDSTFSNDGLQIVSLSVQTNIINSIILQPDGKIVAGGDTTFALARYSLNGYLDYTLNQNGLFSLDIGHGSGSDAAMQSDGKIIIAGSISNGSNTDFAIARYITDVTLSINKPKDTDDFVIYPNPIHDKAILKFKNSNQLNVVFSLRDVTGRKVYDQIVNGNEILFERGMIYAGLYIWTIEDNTGKYIGAGKVVLD